MAIKATFGSMKFERIEGYRISTCWNPSAGFQGHFYVYLWERTDATTPLKMPVEIPRESEAPRDKLQIADEWRTYVFDNIDLSCVEVGANRRERFRLVEFRYNPEEIDYGPCPVSLNNKSEQHVLKKANLKDHYTYKIDDGIEHLLGFEARLSPSAACVLRFSTLRNKFNSFLVKLLDANAQRATSEEGVKPYTIQFSQGIDGGIEVTQENVIRIYTMENYGELRNWPVYSLDDVVSFASADEKAEHAPELARLSLAASTDGTLLLRDSEEQFRAAQLDPHTVETATFVFRPGIYQDLKIT